MKEKTFILAQVLETEKSKLRWPTLVRASCCTIACQIAARVRRMPSMALHVGRMALHVTKMASCVRRMAWHVRRVIQKNGIVGWKDSVSWWQHTRVLLYVEEHM